MAETPASNAAQIDYWNAVAGQTWVQLQEQLDRQISPLGHAAQRALAAGAGERVLDIGCGCGQSTLELAVAVGAAGSVTGVDISQPMLAVARARPNPLDAATLVFRELDAQSGDLGKGVFDAAFSRFGVMFFSDPVAAFANIRAALKPDGRLAFVCWRPFQENPWMSAPMAAALPLLPPQPEADPLAPGPFAFADAARVRGILEGAGFAAVDIKPFEARIGGASVEESIKLAFRVGPLGRALGDQTELAAAISDRVREVIKPFDTPDGVLMPAAVWIVTARNCRSA